jgi:hypothetical protein
MQPAQRPTIAENGAFLNSRVWGGLTLAGERATHAHMLVNRLDRLGLSVKGNAVFIVEKTALRGDRGDCRGGGLSWQDNRGGLAHNDRLPG